MTLHPLSWLALVVTLSALAVGVTNWLLLAIILAGLIALNLVAGSRALLGVALLAGLAVMGLHLTYAGLLGGGAAKGVLFTLPAWTLGPGVRLGGPVDATTLAAGLATGLQGAVLLAGLALLGGVRPAADWHAIARLPLGSAARFTGPSLALGEAITRVHRDAARLRAEGLGGVGPRATAEAVGRRSVDLSADLTDKRSGPWTASVLAVAAVGAAWVFWHGSFFVGPIELSPAQVVALALGVWLAARWVRVGLPWRPRTVDGIVIGLCAVGWVVVEYARRTPEARLLATTAALPALPPITTLVVVCLTVVTVAVLWGGRHRKGSEGSPALAQPTTAGAAPAQPGHRGRRVHPLEPDRARLDGDPITVRAGDVVGILADDPRDGARLARAWALDATGRPTDLALAALLRMVPLGEAIRRWPIPDGVDPLRSLARVTSLRPAAHAAAHSTADQTRIVTELSLLTDEAALIEPTRDLDERAVTALTHRLARRSVDGHTTVIATSDADFATRMCTQVVRVEGASAHPANEASTRSARSANEGASTWRSTLTTVAVCAVALGWLALPLWWSSVAPRAADQTTEAPYVLAALVALGALVAHTWAGEVAHRTHQVQAVVLLAVTNTLARPLLSAGRAGFELVYVLPFLAGAYAGPAAGFLVGLSSGLASAAWAGPLPDSASGQALVWALIGAAGGLLHPLKRWAAALLAAPLGMMVVAVASLGYDLPGWSVAPPASATSFVPGIGPIDAFWRLLLHVLQTAWAINSVRVLVTGAGLALLAYPLLVTLERAFGGRHRDPARDRVVRPLRSEAERRARRTHLHSLWPTTKETTR